MARVFLSYDRDDAAKARSVAEALEQAGHSVWWDRHIKGGSQFNKEIEEALARAQAVVVLWSANSVESAWVRDEAAVGRDSGRLVPALIDSTEPPLGFRQFQTIDLSGRWRRLRNPALQELLAAIAALGADPVQPVGSTRITGSRPSIGRWWAAAALLAVALIGAGYFAWTKLRASSSIPTVTVAPTDSSAIAKSLAGDLLIKLGNLQSAHADALQLVELDADETPDFTFKIGSTAETGDPRAHLALVDNRSGSLLWSREFVQPGGNQADLRQQIAYSAAQVLGCATEALSTEQQKIQLLTLKLYLSGCADLYNLPAARNIETFVKVTQQAPNFPGGWAKLLLVETWKFMTTDMADQDLRRDLRIHITHARRVNPSMAEAFLAEGSIQQPRPISGWMKFVDLAVVNGPDNPDILTSHAYGLVHVGLMQDALADVRRAVESNPLSPAARDMLVEHLLNNGQVEAARNELEKSERLWPKASNVLESRFALEARVGDPARALRMLQSGELGRSATADAESYLEARREPSPANVDRAIADVRALYRQDPVNMWRYILTLALFERHEELVDVLLKADTRATHGVIWVLFRSEFASLHKDRRFMLIAHRYGVAAYWRESGKWADFCSRPDLPYDCKAEAAKLAA